MDDSTDDSNNDRLPLGAIIVVVFGLLLTAGTAWFTVQDPNSGGGARLQWETEQPVPDSKPAALGKAGKLRITKARIDATRDNDSGYQLFRIAGRLTVDTGAFPGQVLASCTAKVPTQTAVLAHTPGKRASYPLPSDDLISQPVPEISIIKFGAKGTNLVGVEVSDVLDAFTNTPGVKVDWEPYKQGEQTWKWVLTPAKRSKPVVLEFVTMWRTTAKPAGSLECSATQQGKHATVKTASG